MTLPGLHHYSCKEHHFVEHVGGHDVCLLNANPRADLERGFRGCTVHPLSGSYEGLKVLAVGGAAYEPERWGGGGSGRRGAPAAFLLPLSSVALPSSARGALRCPLRPIALRRGVKRDEAKQRSVPSTAKRHIPQKCSYGGDDDRVQKLVALVAAHGVPVP
jgi:hypothetical protein